MQYTNLGNTGLIVSRLALGTMTFGKGRLVGELDNDMDQKTADQMVHRSLDAGINLFDTADMYTSGQSEVMLGKALKGRRNEAVVVTKCGFRSGEAINDAGLSYRYVLHAVEQSLRRLDTDFIDVLLLHIPDPFTPLEETCRAMEAVVQNGWVRHVGLSNYTAWEAQQMLDIQEYAGYPRMICAQMYYSLLGRDIEKEFIPFLEANDLGLMVWSPLASGFLTGKYTAGQPVPPDARRAKFDFPPIDVELGYEVVETLGELSESYDATVAQLALGWLLAKEAVSSVIVGARRMEQLEENLGAAGVCLSQSDIDRLDELTQTPDPYPVWMEPMGFDDKKTEALFHHGHDHD